VYNEDLGPIVPPKKYSIKRIDLVSAFIILLIAKTQIENPTNNIPETLFITLFIY